MPECKIVRENYDLPPVNWLSNIIIDEAATSFDFGIKRTRKQDARGLKIVRYAPKKQFIARKVQGMLEEGEFEEREAPGEVEEK